VFCTVYDIFLTIIGVSPLVCCSLIDVEPARVSIADDSSVGFTSELLVYKYLKIVLVDELGCITGVSFVNFFGVSGNFTDLVVV